jgi:hypothetical protein
MRINLNYLFLCSGIPIHDIPFILWLYTQKIYLLMAPLVAFDVNKKTFSIASNLLVYFFNAIVLLTDRFLGLLKTLIKYLMVHQRK